MECSPACCRYGEAVALPFQAFAHARQPQDSALQLMQVEYKHQYPWLLIDLYSFLLPLRHCSLHSRAIFRRDAGPKGPCKGPRCMCSSMLWTRSRSRICAHTRIASHGCITHMDEQAQHICCILKGVHAAILSQVVLSVQCSLIISPQHLLCTPDKVQS